MSSTTWPTPEVPRELPIALAHRFAKTKPGDPLMHAYTRIYAWLPLADQQRCRVELRACRKAMRGELPATIASVGESQC